MFQFGCKSTAFLLPSQSLKMVKMRCGFGHMEYFLYFCSDF